MPSQAPSAPAVRAAASVRPSAMPPAARSGTSGQRCGGGGQERQQAHRPGVAAGLGALDDEHVGAGVDRPGGVVERLDLAHHPGAGLLRPVEPRLRVAEGQGDRRPAASAAAEGGLEQRLEHRDEGGDEPDGERPVGGRRMVAISASIQSGPLPGWIPPKEPSPPAARDRAGEAPAAVQGHRRRHDRVGQSEHLGEPGAQHARTLPTGRRTGMGGSGVRPFQVAVGDDVLDDLAARLARVRWPDEIPGSAGTWEYGTDLGYLQELVGLLAGRLRLAGPGEGHQRVPPVHGRGGRHRRPLPPRRGAGPAPLPLLLCHGWPGSFWEFHRIIPMLTDPGPLRRRPVRRLHGGGAVAAGLRLLVPARPAALQPRGDGGDPRRADDVGAGLRALRGAGRRLGRRRREPGRPPAPGRGRRPPREPAVQPAGGSRARRGRPPTRSGQPWPSSTAG